MPTLNETARSLAKRLTDEQMGECETDPTMRAVCAAHSHGGVTYALPPGGHCLAYRNGRDQNQDSIGHLLDDEAAKDILMEYWDV